MLKIAITGGIAAGKSTAVKYLRKKRLLVVSADEIYHHLINSNKKLQSSIKSAFGKNIYKDGTLDRRALGAIVFGNPEKLKLLNSITHPFVIREMQKIVKTNKNAKLAFFDIPLLFEAELAANFDAIIVITAPRRAQIMRLTSKRGLSIREAKLRIDAQLPLKFKIAHSDYTINNNKNLQNLHKQIDIILKKIYSKNGISD